MLLRRVSLALLIAALPAAPHVVSMSTGELRVDGRRATYELRMPVYELPHLPDPSRELLDAVRFERGMLVRRSCETEDENLVCRAVYEFPEPFESLRAECRLHAVTVPNHIHLLRAHQGKFTAQAIFDAAFPTAELRFRPPTRTEQATRAAAQGAWRPVAGGAPLLFLAVMALAARSRRELAGLVLALVAGEIAAAVVEPRLSRPLPPRFTEAATALTVAYLALEAALLPQAGFRWVVVGALGLLHGFFFARVAALGDFHLAPYFAGLFLVQAMLAAVLGWCLLRIGDRARRMSAWGCAAIGLAWFGWRLLG